MDFLDRVTDYIEEHLELSAPFRWGKLGTDPEAYSIRPTPSSVAARYVKGKVEEFSFQIAGKNADQSILMEEMYEIKNLLDGLSNGEIESHNGSFIFVKCEVYTLPNWVDETDRGESIYTAMFTAEIEGGN